MLNIIMISSTSRQGHSLIKTVNLPRKTQIKSLSILCDQSNTPTFGLYLNSPKFDPNMESSPPNSFMQNLHERMNMYHCSKI